MEIVFAGFVLGFITSFHCAGMCGPIALALPLSGNSKIRKTFAGIIYNLGRTFTYVLAGMIFGLAGQGFNMLGFQQLVSVVSGSLMIVVALLPLLFNTSIEKGFSKIAFTNFIRKGFQKLFSAESVFGLFVIGLLNGLLPCGPLYTALIAATGTGSVIQSVLFMLLFGLGTIPMLLAVTMAGNFLSQDIRKKVRNFLPVLMILMGILFILRGANLGIPYFSPDKEKIKSGYENALRDSVTTTETHECCKKHVDCCSKK